MTTTRHWHSLATRLSLLAALLAASACGKGTAPRSAQVVRERIGPVTGASCTLDGTTTPPTRNCELWARNTTISLPGGVAVAAWGFTDSSTGAATVPGPPIIANEGETVNVVVHNELVETTALVFTGQGQPPDLAGIAPAGAATYSFTAAAPGTFLYEAGLLPTSQYQVAMGLHGALVVRPALAGQAYADPSTAFQDEGLLVLSEIDPALNAAPSTFDMRDFAPRWWLINGKPYPLTDPVTTLAGNTVLLRYVNAGLQHRSMTLLGLRQSVIATSGLPSFTRRVVAESIAPGQTLDALVTVPMGVAGGTRYPLYDGSLVLHNAGAPGFGGMLTFLTVGAAAPGGDTAGPAATAVALTPNAPGGLPSALLTTNGSVDVTLTASLSDAASGGANVTAAEYFIDVAGAGGTGASMIGAFGGPTADVSATLGMATIAALPAGDHLVYVHGQDSAGNWGPLNFAVLRVDTVGPATVAGNAAPALSNGTVAVAVNATGDDRATGGSDIAGGQVSFDALFTTGPVWGMTANAADPVASLDGEIPAAEMAALLEGSFTIYVRAQDVLGNWGPFHPIDLTVDRAGPSATSVAVAPNPNNGTLGINSTVPAVRLTAVLTDGILGPIASNIAAAEGFIDTVGANGTGFPMVARRGAFDMPSEAAFADIPLTTLAQLAEGPHTLHVHGRDAAGNWGPTSSTTLVIDRGAPTVSNVVATPNPTNGPGGTATTFDLTATATDASTNVVAAEWFEGADPGIGAGTPFTIPTPGLTVNLAATVGFYTLGWAPGDHTVSVRARDAAGNWGALASVVVTVVAPNSLPNDIFADGFESGTFAAWNGGATGTNLAVTAAAALVGTQGMQVDVTGAVTGWVTDLTPVADASYHARFWVHPNGVLTGPAPVNLLTGLGAAGPPIFRVQLLHNTPTAQFLVRVVFARAGGNTATRYYPISDAPHAVELSWRSGPTAPLELYLDGVLRQTLTLDTSGRLLESVQLGAGGALNEDASGVLFLDQFASTRATYIGP
jgi:hypothetical protein